MAFSVKKLWNDYGIIGILLSLVVLYVLYMFVMYLTGKGSAGSELMTENANKAYRNSTGAAEGGMSMDGGNAPPRPAEDISSGNEVFASVNGAPSNLPGLPAACNANTIQNPAELLPKDTNSEWAQLNPAGKGELANINLLKAGYHIGIDTISSSLRNANLQIRSEPPNPQMNVGPWNQSTITPDFIRPSFEVGQGSV